MDSALLHRVLKGGLIALFALVPLVVLHRTDNPTEVKDLVFVGMVSLLALGWLQLSMDEDWHHIKRTVLRQSSVTVTLEHMDLAISLGGKHFPGVLDQFRNDFNSVNVRSHLSKYRRLVSGSCPNFENPIAQFDIHALGHVRDNIRL